MSEHVARAALSRLSEPGDARLSGLVGQLGAGKVYDLLRDEEDVGGVFTDVATRLRGLDPERELEEASAKGIRFLCPEDAEWPRCLDDLASVEPLQGRGGAPLGLWARGPLRLDEACGRSAAICDCLKWRKLLACRPKRHASWKLALRFRTPPSLSCWTS